jgi:hypothetical protein
VFSGTAGAENAAVHVGDVVTSGFVADKSDIHYYLGGYQGPVVEILWLCSPVTKGQITRPASRPT